VRTCAAASSTDTASGAAVGFSFTDRQYQWGQGRSCHYTELDGTTATDDTAPLVFLPGFGVGTFHFEVCCPCYNPSWTVGQLDCGLSLPPLSACLSAPHGTICAYRR
jgi:hypothetical protein